MNELRFDGQVALITGAGRGLGKTYATLLAARGAKVIVNDIGVAANGDALAETPADETVAEIIAAGGTAVADRHSVVDGAAAMVKTAIEHYGRLDILINNAGISGGGALADIPPESYDRMVDTHFRGTVAVTRAAWQHLVAAGQGRIVNTSSVSVFGAPFTTHYASAKGAIYALTRGLAGEGKAVGIQVNCIMPDAWTRLTAQIPDEGFQALVQHYFKPEAIAAFVTWLCHRSNSLTGETFHVGGGRAGRVLLLEASGVTASDWSPEAWVGKEAELLDATDFGTPASMLESFIFGMQHLNDETRAILASANLSTEKMEKLES
ncbi:SDR family NAD(P)-dependent oxidoreductase [Denitratisoma oestradiolicum]|uniref:Putative oxidoreductase n=1 Tax=Denitratisoma oestradiolicum TaxID=311182 RepID=A0A6S6XT50_9PROT|nr:SDR family NAD(P)-dependent oxidoreductase [Denitratisoma oestradiolicum]CAB1367925.1 putative oxidoreductase [Denitratisoma oestradiolicum]